MASKVAYDAAQTAVPEDGFDITCVIGRVKYGDGPLSVHEAAFAAIARHDAPGVYSFRAGNDKGDVTRVTVEFVAP